MSLAVLADHLASKGRNGDTMLVHMTPEEVHGLHALALAHGGQLTTNPDTGLPEANFLKKMLPMIAGMALNFIAPGVGTAISGALGITGAAAGAIGTGLAVGGITGLATGSLKQGIMAGLGAYGGASLGSALVGGSSAGASAAAAEAAAQEAAKITAANDLASAMGTEYVSQEATSKALQDAASKAYSNFAAKPLLEQATGSFTALKDAPGGMLGGLGALAKPALMAAAPIMADAMVPTATAMPTGQRYTGTIRPYTFNPFTKQWTAQPTYPAIPVKTEAEPAPEQQPGGMAGGGIVALAAGGMGADPTQQATPTAAQLAAQQSIVADPQKAALDAARSGIAAGMTNEQIANMVNMQYGKNFSAQNVADFMTANNLTRPAPAPAPIVAAPAVPGTTGPAVVFGGDTVTPEYTPVTQPQGPAFQPVAPTMSEVVNAYEQGGGSTRMPTITDIKPNERSYTLNAVADMITGFLKQNPNAKYSEVQQFAQTQGIPEMQARAAFNEFRFSGLTGGSRNAYDYLMGRGAYPVNPSVPGGGPLMRPYSEVVGGSAISRFRPTMPPSSGERGSTTSTTGTTKTTTPSVDTLRTSFDQSIFGKTPEEKAAYYNSLLGQGYTDEQIRAAINAPLDDNWFALRAIAERLRAATAGGGTTTTGGGTTTSSAVTGGGTATTGSGITLLGGAGPGSTSTTSNTSAVPSTPITDFLFGTQNPDEVPVEDRSTYSTAAVDERINNFLNDRDRSFYYDYAAPSRSFDDTSPFARGGLADVATMAAASGGNVERYNLGGYSDGGRLLRGPGDGVSDSIPATIGNKQPARLADGEFVIPARIVSEIGNGSTEAGARKLYAMMDRVQRARSKTTGKGRVAKDTKAEKYLPA